MTKDAQNVYLRIRTHPIEEHDQVPSQLPAQLSTSVLLSKQFSQRASFSTLSVLTLQDDTTVLFDVTHPRKIRKNHHLPESWEAVKRHH
jgi:hypothetical protein